SMLRLVAYAPDGVRRFPLLRAEMLIGSAPDCDVCLPHIGVAQRHARLRCDGDALRIEDLGSRKGLLVSGRKVREAALEVLDEVRIGNVTLLVEDVAQGAGALSPGDETEPSSAAVAGSTAQAAGGVGASGGVGTAPGPPAEGAASGPGSGRGARRPPRMSSE